MRSTDFSSSRILVTRTDRLGDVLLATPVLRRLREFYPNAKISFLVQAQWMSILPNEQDGIDLIPYDPSLPANELTEILKAKKFDVAIVIRDERKVTRAVRKAKIPVRVGPYSSLRSFFSFNAGLLQKRSQCKMHEAEYNLELLTKIGVPQTRSATSPGALPRSWIHLNEMARAAALGFLKAHDLQSKNFICFHPGSSGSARYLSLEKMISLARELQAQGNKIVLTGSQAEASLLDSIQKAVPGTLIFGGNDPQPLAALAALYENAKTVIAHGTGPLHLAAAAGAPVLAIFPPIFVLSEKRWGPLTSQRVTWVPPVDCPAKFKCLGEKCKYYDCMDRFQPHEIAVNSISALVNQK